MWPGASVSGYYLWNPASHYFGVGRIGRDQLADYAARKGIPLAEAERWLAPNLADEDETARARDEPGGARRGVRRVPGPLGGRRRGRAAEWRRPATASGARPRSVRHLIAVEARGLAAAPGAGSRPRTTRTGRGRSRASRPGFDDASLARRILAAFAGGARRDLATVRALDEAGWARFGTHATYGRLDVAGLLRLAIDHDEEHLAGIGAELGRRPSGIVRTVVRTRRIDGVRPA